MTSTKNIGHKTGAFQLPNYHRLLTYSEGERQTIISQGKAEVCEIHNHTVCTFWESLPSRH